MSAWAEWVIDAAGTDVSTVIAKATGINQSSVYRWLNEGAVPSPAHAARVAETYNREVLEAFVAAEFLTAEEAGLEDPLAKRIELLERQVELAQISLIQAQQELTEARQAWAARNETTHTGHVGDAPPGRSRAYRRVAELKAAVRREYDGESAGRLEASLADLLRSIVEAERDGPINSEAIDALIDTALVSNDGSADYYAESFRSITLLLRARNRTEHVLAADSSAREPFDDETGDGQ